MFDFQHFLKVDTKLGSVTFVYILPLDGNEVKNQMVSDTDCFALRCVTETRLHKELEYTLF